MHILSYYILILLIGFVALPGIADDAEKLDAAPAEVTATDEVTDEAVVEEEAPYDCETAEASINTQIDEVRECWESTDCFTTSFGYPWQQAVCQSIVSKSEPELLANIQQDISDHKANCINPYPEKLAAFKAYEPIADACPKVTDLVCVSGRCMTLTESMLQFDDADDVDDYGSRKFLEPVDVPKKP